LIVLTKKPQVSTSEESDRNPRSRSAKLRAVQRVSKEGHS
jgi:16S rRNA (cytosine1402-N4)-methyltransferase